jgi:antitoxin ParD1/3/4
MGSAIKTVCAAAASVTDHDRQWGRSTVFPEKTRFSPQQRATRYYRVVIRLTATKARSMTGKSITLTLGKQQQVLDAMVASGDFESHSEAVRAAVRALQREREAVTEVWRAKIKEALDDPRPAMSPDDFFGRMRDYHDRSVKAAKRGA